MGLQIFGILLSAAALLIGSLVLWNLKMMVRRLDKIDMRVDILESENKEQQKDLGRSFVDKVDFIREVTSQRRTMDQLVGMVSEMKGSMKVIEKIPQIAGNIAREIVKEMKQ